VKPFVRATSAAVVLDRVNMDTDQIIPARFLRKSRRTGYQDWLFHDLRRDAAGALDPDFPLNRPEAAGAAILLVGRNFGSGSSREGAVYALVDAGIVCVVAPSFGDIFSGNAAKNGLLTVVLPEDEVRALMAAAAAGPLTVDLEARTVSDASGRTVTFGVDEGRRRALLEGLDEIGGTRQRLAEIEAAERAAEATRPWTVPRVRETTVGG